MRARILFFRPRLPWIATLLVAVLGVALCSPRPVASQPLSDVVVSGLVITPRAARANDPVTATVTLRNEGSGPGASLVSLYLATSSRLPLTSAVPLWTLAVEELAPGASEQVSKSFTVPAVPPGSFSVIAVARGAASSAENNDNRRTAGLRVAIADLSVSRLTLSPRLARVGDRVTAAVVVRNVGQVPADTSALHLYFESTSATPSSPATVLGTAAIDALKPGESRELSPTFTVPPVPHGRSYYVWARAALDGGLPEANEGNNRRGARLSVSVPDLAVSGLAVTPGPARAGDPLPVTLRVRNRGPVPASASQARLYVTTASNASLDGLAPVAKIDLPGLAAGAELRWTEPVPVPVLSPGYYYLTAVADASAALSEASETNNLRSTKFEVAVPAVALDALSLTPSLVQPGQAATASVRIVNRGRAWSRPTTADVFLATSESAELREGAPIMALAVDSLRPGGSVRLPVPLTVPLVDPGAHYVIAQVDASTAVGAWTRTVATAASTSPSPRPPRKAAKLQVALPDLAVSELSASSTQIRPGATIPIVLTVRNAGSVAAASTLTVLLFGACADSGLVETTTLRTIPVPPLGPGASARNAITVTVPPVEPGSYCLKANADSTGAVAEAVEANNRTVTPVSVVGATVTLVPQVDPTQLEIPWPMHSHYKQPWRAWLETVPGEVFRSGVGINYRWDTPRVDHALELRLLAESGFSRIRVDVGWCNVDYDTGDLASQAKAKLRAIAVASRNLGIRPLILVYAHHGIPGPARALVRRVAKAAPAGSRTLQLDDVSGLTTSYTGLSNLTGFRMAEVFITAVDPVSRRVSLSQPLPVALSAGEQVDLHTLKYLPLHAPGSPRYEETLAGWLDYVRAVANTLVAAGLPAFDVEIWNELTFGSDFLSINNYYDPPVYSASGSPYRPGGAAWELARRTVDMLANEYPEAVPIWGFSNTTFFHTEVRSLPPGTLGQSYHPYFFLDYASNADEQYGFDHNLEGFAPTAPPYRVLMPETAGTFLKAESLAWHINPVDRQTRPAGSPTFEHVITELGFNPEEKGVSDPATAEHLKAKTVLRASFFWLNKGLRALWFFADLDAGGRTGYDLLPESVTRLSAYPADPAAFRTPAMTALANASSLFAEARPIASPRHLDVSLAAVDGEGGGIVFDGDASHPSLTYPDVLAALPFQIDDRTFVLGLYVMTRNILEDIAPVPFQVRIGNVDGTRTEVSYLDPLTGRDVQVQVTSRDSHSITLALPVVDYPYLLRLRE